jgi:hypothetical protein
VSQLGALPGSEGGALLVSLGSYTQTKGAELAYEFSSGWGLAGAYKGKVDLAPADAAKGDLDLTVNVTDAIWYPILLLLIGVLVTAWMQNWLGVRRQLWEIVYREAAASTLVDQFKPVAGYSIQADAAKRLSEVKTEAERLDRVWRKLLLAPNEAEKTKKEHAELEEKLAGIELQLAYWTEKWPAKLAELRAALDKMLAAIETASRPPVLPTDQQRPTCYETAKLLCQGGELTLDEFAKKAVQVDKAIILAGKWDAWQKALAWARDRLAELQGMTPDEEKLATDARQQANSAWVDLWTATDLDDLAAHQTEAEVAAAVDGVSRLLHRLPLRAAHLLDFSAWAEQEGAILPVMPVKDLPAAPEDRAKRAQRALRLGDGVVLGIAVVVALATGLSQLYFGKNFGSLDDWLKALTWGAGAKLGVDLVKTAMDRMFVRS